MSFDLDDVWRAYPSEPPTDIKLQFDKIMGSFNNETSREIPAIIDEKIKKSLIYNLVKIKNCNENEFLDLDFNSIFIGEDALIKDMYSGGKYIEYRLESTRFLISFFSHISDIDKLKIKSINLSNNHILCCAQSNNRKSLLLSCLAKLQNLSCINLSNSLIAANPDYYNKWRENLCEVINDTKFTTRRSKIYEIFKIEYFQNITSLTKSIPSLKEITLDINPIYHFSILGLLFFLFSEIEKDDQISTRISNNENLVICINGFVIDLFDKELKKEYISINTDILESIKSHLDPLNKGIFNEYLFIDKEFKKAISTLLTEKHSDSGLLYLKLMEVCQNFPQKGQYLLEPWLEDIRLKMMIENGLSQKRVQM